MREVTCPVYPCVWSVLAGEDLAEVARRHHLRAHSADDFVAGFEALTAQNTRQLKHLGELNDELHAARKQRDREAKRADEILERMASENARLRQQRDEARGQRDRECARADRMLGVLEAARAVVKWLRLLDKLGLTGSVSGPSRSLVVAMADYDADPRTEPRPAQGESELTDTEGRVVPCPKCSQPHGDGGVCGTDIREAA